MALETTLVLVKPDGVRRGLCGEVVARFEQRGYELRGARLLKLSRPMAATNPADAAPGTIRGDLATELAENIVHGSDSRASAKRELALFFPDGML